MADLGNIAYTVIDSVGVHYEKFPLTQGLVGLQLETADAPTPPTGYLLLYANTDDTWHQKTSDGTDTSLLP